MTLRIEQRGHGPQPLVLIHGWAMHGGIFAPLVEALADRCSLYVVDLPGHGHSRACGLALEPRAIADAIAKATPPAPWLGWSLGGLVALTAALDDPAHVQGLAILCATPKFVRSADWPHGSDATLVHQLALDLEAGYHATIERFLALEAMGSDDPKAELRRLRTHVFERGEPELRVLQEGIGLLERTDLRARLPRLAVPSVWIAGRRDRLVPPAAMAWSAEQCGGRFVEIAHAGHAPFIGHAQAVAEALQPLFAEIPA
ncbi:pimeloyl-ACP methyl ester esterase BioH [Frateuria terrea]|uniref:Pimeloyl-[acyl-carrier protein] methyl ester esterase n=1 Tax=Frateuria terrea TaxID=529704 RepID=A0A1H6XP98_9GAMM|nr:pimeloyl-ACP methyl ester esterase BioH [Frateuria terrea]SEJ26375.1 pimeloyl-[acyl-carrier protein] methyl ester esterase [Frateuria terrea]SFP60515.1 pimeloyl-[acyl-carrier protein] methyl ester esterase [Frateuria terrea]